jgi:glycosyltransferase involved in cell wall biosynthesis
LARRPLAGRRLFSGSEKNKLIPIRVLYLITELNMGGAQQALFRLLSGLDRNRYQPIVACLYNGRSEVAQQINQSGIRVIDLGMQPKWRLDAVWRLHRLVQREKPVILHAWMIHANILGRIVGRLNRVPVVIISRRTQNLDGVGREWVNRKLSGWSDATIAVSECVRQVEIARARTDPAKVITIHNGIEAEQYRQIDSMVSDRIRRELHTPLEAVVIASVGRLHPVKGFANLLTAMKSIHARFPDVFLWLVGDGEQRTALEAQVRQLGLENVVVFAGMRRDIPEILTAVDIFTLASHVEGMPNAVLEAMAAGLPVVATQVGGVPEIVVDGQTGLLVPPADVQALARGLLTLIEDAPLRQRFGVAGRQRVFKRFDIAVTRQKTVDLYGRLLQEKGLT